MFDSILTRITGFLDKDLLFGSLLPILLLSGLTIGGLSTIAGGAAVWAWLASITAVPLGLLIVTGVVVLIVSSYALVAVRPLTQAFWCGTSALNRTVMWGITYGTGALERRRYTRLVTTSRILSPWGTHLRTFEKAIQNVWSEKGTAINETQAAALLRIAHSLAVVRDVSEFERRALRIYKAFSEHPGSSLETVYSATKDSLVALESDRERRSRSAAAKLDREFGVRTGIQPTRLGNTLAAMHEYAYSRYGMEGEAFFTRLRAAMTVEQHAAVQDPRILMDFSLAMASGLLIMAFAVAYLGIHLWDWPTGMMLATGGLLLGSVTFYRLAVAAATQFSELVRAAFDVYRLSLLTALHRPWPSSLAAERAMWREVSSLAAYGGAALDFQVGPAPK